MMPESPLLTSRLTLRPVRPEDADAMYELDASPAVHMHLASEPIGERSAAERTIAKLRHQYVERGIGFWAVVLTETSEFVGWSGIRMLSEAEQMNGFYDVPELGYRFIPRFWGRGYATEAAAAWVNYMFTETCADVLYAVTSRHNHGSKNVLAKTGFKMTSEYVQERDGMSFDCCWFEQRNPLASRCESALE